LQTEDGVPGQLGGGGELGFLQVRNPTFQGVYATA
jgi:hypothetical protein